MKILCSNCGLRYDPQLQNGICPHCGRYNEPGGADTAQSAPPPAESEPAYAVPGPEALPPLPQVPRRRVSAVPVALCLLFGAALLLEMLLFPLAARRVKQQGSAQNFVPDAAVSRETQGAPFAFGPRQRQVTVGGAETLEGLRGVQPGAVMVRVWCGTKKMQEYASNWDADVFLQAGDAYYPALSDYDLEGFYPELTEEMLDPYELVSTAMAEGWLYFVVPGETRQATLWLQSQTIGRDYAIDGVEMTGIELTMTEGSVSEP